MRDPVECHADREEPDRHRSDANASLQPRCRGDPDRDPRDVERNQELVGPRRQTEELGEAGEPSTGQLRDREKQEVETEQLLEDYEPSGVELSIGSLGAEEDADQPDADDGLEGLPGLDPDEPAEDALTETATGGGIPGRIIVGAGATLAAVVAALVLAPAVMRDYPEPRRRVA